MLKHLNNYFGFNRQQRNGLFLLICISALLFVIRLTYPYFMPPGDLVIKDLPLVKREMEDKQLLAHTSHPNFHNDQNKTLFAFDPNVVSRDELIQLGLKEKTADIFIRFRNKGFQFKQKEDIKKVYGISDKLYVRLEPYIIIHWQNKTPDKEAKTIIERQPQKQVELLDLNQADTLALQALPGIGSAYARRIVKYRDLLGGFVRTEQLLEVYGFKEETFEKIKDRVRLGSVELRKINLNRDDFKTVNRHPYLSYELTKKIFQFRKSTAITTTNLGGVLEDEALAAKIGPYLSFD